MLKIENQKFRRLYSLGSERLSIIENQLAQGASPTALARLIQQEWGEFQDVAEKTLYMQLCRYRDDLKTSVADAADGKKIITTTIDRLNVIHEIAQLIETQKQRIKMAVEKEKGLSGVLLKGVNTEIETLHNMLKDLQKLQFDLGLDTYKGPVVSNGKVVQASVTTPDGTNVTMTVQDAMREVQGMIDQYTPGEVQDVLPR